MKKLKVYGGNTFLKLARNPNGSTQGRTIVCAESKKRAVELLKQAGDNTSLHHFNGYWCETGNKIELLVAGEPGVWVNEGHWGNEANYRRVV